MKAITTKYQTIKYAALDSDIIDDVKLAFSEEDAMTMIDTAKSTLLIVFPIEASIMNNTDNIIFSLFVIDKVNNTGDELHVLNSWDTSMLALRYIADMLNYKESEDVLIDEVELGIYQNDNKSETTTMVRATIDMSIL